MKRIIPALVVLSALSLGACSTNPVEVDSFGSLAEFTVEDLKAADEMAVASGDNIAHLCYPALIRFVSETAAAGNSTATVKGAFSAYQKARNIRHRVGDGIPDYVRIGCAPLVSDSASVAAKLLLLVR